MVLTGNVYLGTTGAHHCTTVCRAQKTSKRGARCFIAVSGGINTPSYLGSRSTFPGGKLGGVQVLALLQTYNGFRNQHAGSQTHSYRPVSMLAGAWQRTLYSLKAETRLLWYLLRIAVCLCKFS